jgi:glycosyltransferase involved in cell wall biosynthesis
MSRVIFYFVDEVESTFVLNDLIKVAEKYEKVYLFSIDILNGKEKLPSNVDVFENFMEWKRFKPFSILLRNLFPVLGIYLFECLTSRKILPLKASVATLTSNIFKALEITRHINKSSLEKEMHRSPFYSFWFYDCIYLAWMKRERLIDLAITRAHSGDLYEDHTSIKNKILYRNFQFRYLDAVLPISRMGTDYLQKRYPRTKAAIKTIFLGSENPVSLNPFDKSQFTIVSCASFRHHKRIHKIAEALLHVNIPITWHHFGDENIDKQDPKIHEYLARKKELQSKLNIKFLAHGNTENEKLFEFYRKNPVNLFVSLSSAEGIPVSMMEAISFGIPILSTDVGGCKEIVNEETGILIPLETEITEVADIITSFRDSSKNTSEFRSNVRLFWERHFDAERNYSVFFDFLKS